MDFSNEKYEYMVKTRGGFYDKNNDYKPGYFFFNSEEDRQVYIYKLNQLNKDHGFIMKSLQEGRHVRYRTVANMVMTYKGIDYKVKYDFGFGYPVSSAKYSIKDGNYACDCNRSSLIIREHGEVIEYLECGDEIKLSKLDIAHVRCEGDRRYESEG